MARQAVGANAVTSPTGRLRCWVESLTLGLGLPALIWFFSKLITSSVPAAVSGSPEQRFFFWFIAGVIAEWLFVIGVWFLLKKRGVSFRDFGRLAGGNLVSVVISSRTSRPFYSEQPPSVSPNANPHLLCVCASWISPFCSAHVRNHRRVL